MVIVNALPKTVTVKKVIKEVPTITTTSTEREPTTTTTTEKEPSTTAEQEVDVAPPAGPQYIPEREAALTGNELTEEDSAAVAFNPE